MSESAEQDRSELPSHFKLERARREGSVARGTDLGFFAALLAATGFAWFGGAGLSQVLSRMMADSLAATSIEPIGQTGFIDIAGFVSAPLVRPLLIFLGAVFAVVLTIEFVQTGPVFSTKALALNFGRLNPATGLKRLFTPRILIETAKAVVKLVIYAAITGLFVVKAATVTAAGLSDASDIADAMSNLSLGLLAAIAGGAAIFAVLDQIVARRDFLKKMRMSRRELRREHRDREGDSRLKQRRKELHGQFAKVSQSLRGIREADVVVTNPIHFAVALKYDPASMQAPLVVSRGAHSLALRLRKLAFSYGVTVVTDPVLARALYRKSDVNRPIPEACYSAVADLYLMLRRQKRERSAGADV